MTESHADPGKQDFGLYKGPFIGGRKGCFSAFLQCLQAVILSVTTSRSPAVWWPSIHESVINGVL